MRVGSKEDFAQRLLTRVLSDAHQHQQGAVGGWGGVEPLSPRQRAADMSMALVNRAGLVRRGYSPDEAAATLSLALQSADQLVETEELLADRASQELLMTLLSFRALGPRHVALPVSEKTFREGCKRVDRDLRVAENVLTGPHGAQLHRYEVPGRDGPVTLTGAAFLVHEFFGVEQYALRRDSLSVRAEPGDVVVDGGGGWGETALYFADAVGPDGHVLCFEFVPDNLEIVQLNLEHNPRLEKRIDVVPHPLWHTSGEAIEYGSNGGQSSLVTIGDVPRSEARTESLDQLCLSREIDRIDFIKLDVEGAEMAALRGAEDTIRRCRPKLAVSVYHHPDDLTEIPAWIYGLDLGYSLHLDHLWPGVAETILFARPPR